MIIVNALFIPWPPTFIMGDISRLDAKNCGIATDLELQSWDVDKMLMSIVPIPCASWLSSRSSYFNLHARAILIDKGYMFVQDPIPS